VKKFFVNQVVLSGHDRFEPDIEYEVEDELAQQFTDHGWVGQLVESQPRNVTLDVHDVSQGQTSEVK